MQKFYYSIVRSGWCLETSKVEWAFSERSLTPPVEDMENSRIDRVRVVGIQGG